MLHSEYLSNIGNRLSKYHVGIIISYLVACNEICLYFWIYSTVCSYIVSLSWDTKILDNLLGVIELVTTGFRKKQIGNLVERWQKC